MSHIASESTQVLKNTANVMAGNTAALAILSWLVSAARPLPNTPPKAFPLLITHNILAAVSNVGQRISRTSSN